MRTALLVVALALSSTTALAQSPGPAPYQRMRTGAGDWHARGGHGQNWRGGGIGFGGFYDPFFFSPPIVAGSWYERPYPHHFDYYRHRWGGPSGMPQTEMMPVADCPCLAGPPPVEVVQ